MYKSRDICSLFVPWSKVAILGMVIPPLIGILIMGIYINPYYWVDDHPLIYGINGSLDPGTFGFVSGVFFLQILHGIHHHEKKTPFGRTIYIFHFSNHPTNKSNRLVWIPNKAQSLPHPGRKKNS